MLKDNFNKFCLAIIALLLLLSLFFSIRASAEEYEPPADQPETTTESTEETHEVTQVTGVQVNDPTLYEKLDKMQESIDALTAALAPSADAEVPAESPAPDYSAQLDGISAQLVQLNTAATAETAELSAFEKPFSDYSTSETLTLVLVAAVVLLAFVCIIKNFIL